MRIPHPQINRGPPLPPALCYIWVDKWVVFSKVLLGFRNSGYDYWVQLGEMFEGDFANKCSEIFSLMSMGRQAVGLAWADPGARTPISVSGNFYQKTRSQSHSLMIRCSQSWARHWLRTCLSSCSSCLRPVVLVPEPARNSKSAIYWLLHNFHSF